MGKFSDLMKEGPRASTPQIVPRAPKPKKNLATRPPSKNCTIVTNVTLLQSDIEDMREPAYSALTIRFRDTDLEILKDTVYQLRKSMNKKMSQSDVVRLGIRLINKLAAKDGALDEAIGQIK